MITIEVPDPIVEARGTFTPPAVTPERLERLREHAESQAGQLRDDLFLMIATIEQAAQAGKVN